MNGIYINEQMLGKYQSNEHENIANEQNVVKIGHQRIDFE